MTEKEKNIYDRREEHLCTTHNLFVLEVKTLQHKHHNRSEIMAAHLAGVRNGLIGLGFSQAAANAITAEQGYDSLESIAELTDTTIVDLVTTIRKPGGTIPNPAIPPVPPTIPNPGVNIGHRAVTNLKLGAFVTRHYIRTFRPMDNPVQLLALNHIQTFLGLKNAEDA